MAVDLKLLPIEGSTLRSWDPVQWGTVVFSHCILTLTGRRQLFTEIGHAVEAETFPTVPKNFHTFLSRGPDGETCYGDTQTDPYGDRIVVVPASFLLRFKDHDGVKNDSVNRASWAYLAELRPDHPIALYWD